MAERYINSHIRQIPLFAGLSDDQLRLVSQAFEVRNYNTQEVIFREGESAEGMLTLITGQAVLLQMDHNSIQQPIATVIANQTINQEALFSNIIQSATLYVQRPVQALKLTRAKFMTLLSHHPELKIPLGLSQKDTSHHVHDVHFQGQRENEQVMVFTRRHWWAFMRLAWLPIIVMIGLWVAAILVSDALLSTVLFIISIVFPGLAILYFYAEWRNDSVIVTDQRVIRISRTILTLNTKVSEVGIESVHEVNSEIPSYDPFARLFNYGVIHLKTAGDAGNLHLDLIPNPEQFQQIIIEDRNRYIERQAMSHRNAVRAELDSWLAGEDPERLNHPTEQQVDPNAPPKPKQGNYGYLRTRIEMTNGDIIYRKHVIMWLRKAGIPLLLIIFSIGEGLLSVLAHVEVIGLPIGMLMFLIGAVTYYWADWDWRNDYYVVSDDTITLIHQRPLWLENLRDQILMERVDNVVSESSGLLPTLLKYGDVRVSLIGADKPKMFYKVPKPQEIQQEISRRQQRLKQRKSQSDAHQQREIIGEYLNVFNEHLKEQGLVSQDFGNPSSDRPVETYQVQGQFSNLPPGTTTSQSESTIPGRPSPDNVPVRALDSRDRNRPPGIPRKRFPTGPTKPTMTPGVPYDPDNQTGNRPPRFGGSKKPSS